jgi:hypothetical protein
MWRCGPPSVLAGNGEGRSGKFGALYWHTRYLADFARCVVLLHVAPEIIKDANEVAIKIGGDKLAQLPRFAVYCRKARTN